MRNVGLEEAQAGIKIARRNINNLRYADDTTLMAENEDHGSMSWKMLVWVKHKLESRLLGEISITSDMQMIPLLWQKVKRN